MKILKLIRVLISLFHWLSRDNYRGFRIVGAATNIFEEVDFGDGRPLEIELGHAL